MGSDKAWKAPRKHWGSVRIEKNDSDVMLARRGVS